MKSNEKDLKGKQEPKNIANIQCSIHRDKEIVFPMGHQTTCVNFNQFKMEISIIHHAKFKENLSQCLKLGDCLRRTNFL